MLMALLLAQAAPIELRPAPAEKCQTQVRVAMDGAGYAAAQTELKGAGYRLVHEAVGDVGGRPSFAALWVRDAEPPRVSYGAHGVEAFYYASLTMTGQDYRLVKLTVGVVGGSPYFSALWAKNRPVQQIVDYWLTEVEVRRKLKQRKLRVLAIAPYGIGNTAYFAALFDMADGAASAAAVGLTAKGISQRDKHWRRKGYLLSRVTSMPNRAGRYVAVWRQADALPLCERNVGRMEPIVQRGL